MADEGRGRSGESEDKWRRKRGLRDPYKRRQDIRRDLKRVIERGERGDPYAGKSAEYNINRLQDRGVRSSDGIIVPMSTVAGAVGGRFLGRRVAGISNRLKGRSHHGFNAWSRNAKDDAAFDRGIATTRGKIDVDPGRSAVLRAGRAGAIGSGIGGYALGEEHRRSELKKRGSRGAASARDTTRRRMPY